MRSLIILATVLFPLFSWADSGRDLQHKVNELRELQTKVKTQCIDNPLKADVRLIINGTTLTCDNLIVLADRLQRQLDREVTELKERCDPARQETEAARLARASAQAVEQTACRPASTDSQCMGLYGCAAFSIANPLANIIGNLQRYAGNNNSCAARGAAAAPGCLQNVIKGIFDSLWSLLSLVWDIGKAAIRSVGEWTGLIQRQERSSSERLMAAQQAGPGFIRRFISNPGQVMQQMITAMYEGIKTAAMNSYGCEQWTGAPFVSRCLRPMTNWNCATCQQKLQLMCGVAGFAIGEIGTSFLTGGLASGARVIGTAVVRGVQAGARASRFSTLARNVIRTIPRPPAAAVRAAGRVVEATAVVMTATQRAAVRSFEALAASRPTRAIRTAAGAVSRSIVGQTTRFILRPIGFYIEALDNAFMAGMRTADAGIAVVATTVNRTAGAADAGRVAEAGAQGLPELNAAIPPEARATVTLAPDEVTALSRADDVVDGAEGAGDAIRVAPEANAPAAPAAPNAPVAPAASNGAPEVLTREQQTERLITESQIDDLVEGTPNTGELIVRYAEDPEYRALFQAEKAYPEQSRDIAIVIKDMERRNPTMTKPQIREEIRVLMSTCGPRR